MKAISRDLERMTLGIRMWEGSETMREGKGVWNVGGTGVLFDRYTPQV